MENLLNLLKAALPNNFASLVSQYLGESEASTKTSLSALLPALLGAIFKKGVTPSGAGDLLHLFKTESIDADILNNIAGILSGSGNAANELVHHGSALVTQLFSDQETAVGESLASLGGIKSSSAMDLLALAVPVVLGFLKKYILGRNLDQNSLASLFAGQGQYLEGLLDNRLLKALGFASPTAFFSGFTPPKVEPRTQSKAECPIQPKVEPLTQPKVEPISKPAYVPEPDRRRHWLPWLLGLLGLLGLLYLWQVFSKPSVPPAVKAPAMAPVAFCLPANIYFEVGLAVIDAANQETVNKTAQCIKKEGLKVAVSGYTDRTGDWQTNVELAKNRALVVRDALVAAGVPETSIAMADPKEWTGTTTGTGSDREARRVEITKQ
jgi:outer membrane protein OmpA-like peptidoglycan-associated protein